MKKNIKNIILIKIRNFKRKILSSISSKADLSPVQEKAVSIIKKAIVKKSSTLLIDPVRAINYIEYEHYFIKFSSTFAVITNGQFSYYIDYDYKVGEDLTRFFNRIVTSRRDAMENFYAINTLRSLNGLLENLSD
jgi:hypothetical protein